MQPPLKILATIIVILTAIWYVSAIALNNKENNDQKIPSVEVLASNPKITEKDNLVYFNNSPYSGSILAYYSSGQLKASTQYLNGLKHGATKAWFENGQIQQDKQYQEGQPIGTQKSWDQNGIPITNYSIQKNGKKEGLVGRRTNP